MIINQSDLCKDWSRRKFIVSLAVAGLVGTSLLDDRVSASGVAWVPVGSADSIKRGQMQKVTSGATSLFLSRKTDGSVVAYSSKCTHMGCIIAWNSAQSQFTCPCHGGRFDQDGINVSGPPRRPLDNYDVRVDTDKKVYVKLPE